MEEKMEGTAGTKAEVEEAILQTPEEELPAENPCAPSESNADGECVRGEDAQTASPDEDCAETEDQESLQQTAEKLLRLLRLAHKEECSLAGTSARGGADYGMTARERGDLADWNRRYPDLAMTPAEWKKKG